jgi:RNA polymerase sigma-70 factor (ECF subfamily)
MQAIHSSALKTEIAASIPRLRAFALLLCRNPDGADDLVELTLVKAWAQIDSWVEGADLTKWLMTILRNAYFSRHQEQRCKGSDRAGIFVSRLAIAPERNDGMTSLDVRSALAHLPADQREALILVCGAGCSDAEAADICGCTVGAIRRRIDRGRRRLADSLFGQSGANLEPAGVLGAGSGFSPSDGISMRDDMRVQPMMGAGAAKSNRRKSHSQCANVIVIKSRERA